MRRRDDSNHRTTQPPVSFFPTYIITIRLLQVNMYCYVPNLGEAVLQLRRMCKDSPQRHRSTETLSKTLNQAFYTSAQVTDVNRSSSSSYSNIEKSCCREVINLRSNDRGCWTTFSPMPTAASNHTRIPPLTQYRHVTAGV